MGKAFKCDRCGKLYEKEGLYEKRMVVIILRDKQDKLTAMDYCPDCEKKFLEWWQNASD